MSSLDPSIKVHPLAEVATTKIGAGTSVWQFAIILAEASIGNNCNINCHTFIENDVYIGNNVTVKSGVYLWDGIRIEDNVFIGPNATFTNDPYPRSKQYPVKFHQITVQYGATIGANAIVLGGIVVGRFAFVGAGSVVTKSVPDFALVIGNPARIIGWVDEQGVKLEESDGVWKNKTGKLFKVIDQQLRSIE